MNLQDSNQRNQENSQKLNEGKQKKCLYKCDKCCDTGWILIPQENMQPLAISCECRKIEKLKGEWKHFGIKVEYSTQTFSNFEVWNKASENAKNTAVAYYNDFAEVRDGRRNSILLCGQYRYLNFLPMIVSSEFSIDKLLDFDEGVGSRIYEMCKNYVVEIGKYIGNNYRLK